MKTNSKFHMAKKLIKQLIVVLKIMFLKIICEKITKKKLFEINEIKSLL